MKTIYGVVDKELTLEDLQNHKRQRFLTTQSDLKDYNNQPFEIVRSLNEDEVDLVVAPMFKIKFADGFETDAFMDEVYDETLFDVIKEENLVRE